MTASDSKAEMNRQALHVLFLCTHNSARSILAEAILNHLGRGRFKAYSAGSSPRENQQPNPLALETLRRAGISTDGLRSKSWDEFAEGSGPQMDLVITVCDNAAGEVCPYWPGHPSTAHWGYPDPSGVQGSREHQLDAFRSTLHSMRRRLDLLVNLPEDKLSRLVLESSARELSHT
jgi:arsenate reductase